MKVNHRKRIYLSPPYQSGNESVLIQEVLDDNWLSTAGRHLQQFEEKLEALFDYPSVVALQSGTAALHLILQHLGIGEGDKVLVSDLTFVGSVNPIIYQKATPVFLDSERETWNMCPEILESYLSEHQNDLPKAVVLVHLYGVAAKVEKISDLCRKYGVPLIEDCAEALGTEVNGTYVGNFGDYAFLSFNGNKLITTSGGGAVITSDHEAAAHMLYLSLQAKSDELFYYHEEVGFNYRMSNVLAALGLAQLSTFTQRLEKKRSIFRRYVKELAPLGFDFLPFREGNSQWLTVASIQGYDPISLVSNLDRLYNIEARPVWKPMHQQPLLLQYPHLLKGVSSEIFAKGICLPSGAGLSSEDQEFVCDAIKKVITSPG